MRKHHHAALASITVVVIAASWIAAMLRDQAADVPPRLPLPSDVVTATSARAATGLATVTLNSAVDVRAELARTPAERARGLSGHPGLGPDEGMLFLFDRPQPQRFWMNGMLFPLDFVWIRGGIIVDLHAEVPVHGLDGQVSVVEPSSPVDAVLELPAGFIAQWGLAPGQSVQWAVDR